MFRLRNIAIFVFLTALFQPAYTASYATTLSINKPIVREVKGGEEHPYELVLKEGQFANIIVEQRGIDLTVDVTLGQTSILFDNEFRNEGKEVVEIVAATSGAHHILVKPSSKSSSAGSYEIRVAEVRESTTRDRQLQEARILHAAFNRAMLQGNYDDARNSMERALHISESILGSDHLFVAALLYDSAKYYDITQDFEKSIGILERALKITEAKLNADDPQTLNIIRFLAWINYDSNDVAKAEGLIAQSTEKIQKALGSKHFLVAQHLATLAEVSKSGKAKEETLNQALSITGETVGSEHPFYGELLNTLGGHYVVHSDLEKAEQFLQQAKEVYERNNQTESASYARNLNNFGRLAREKKDYDRAEECYQRAITIFETAFGPNLPKLTPILNNLANIYRLKGDYAKSLEMHLRVLHIAETSLGPYHPMTLQSLGNIARTYSANGNILEAIQYQARVDAVLERNIEMNLAIGSEKDKIAFMQEYFPSRTDRCISLSANLAPENRDASAQAALVLLQRKGRVLDAMSESLASIRQRATPEVQSLLQQFTDVTAELANAVLDGPQKSSFAEHQQKVRALEERRSQLESEISRRSAEFRAQYQPITLASIQSAIPEDAALIEFAVYRQFNPKSEHTDQAYSAPRYIGYVLRSGGGILWRDLGEVKTVDQTVDALRQALRDPKNAQVQSLARKLDAAVLQPLRPLIGDARHLLISADGQLNLVPFEALVDENNHYVIENFSCTYLTSGRDLLRMQVQRESKGSPVVLANPIFGEWDPVKMAHSGGERSTTSGSGLSDFYFAPLPGADQEAKAIKSIFAEATILTKANATEAALKMISAPSILHVATHGFFLPEMTSTEEKGPVNPLLRSGLALAGANLKKSGTEDGILTGLEASGLNLWGTKLVILSACDTGVGEIRNGEGAYGLRRAFLLAGTETLVMSLWPISDYVTRELMTSYYQGLKAGLGRSEALRKVQLSMIHHRGREHPFYWASFIQSGEWANLDGKR